MSQLLTVAAVVVLLLVEGCAHPSPSMDRRSDGRPEPIGYVQSFYDWYLEPNHDVDVVLAERPGLLAPRLRGLIQAERKCVSESGEICRLDVDPFTGSQDPCPRYEAADRLLPLGDERLVWVNVYAACGGRRDSVASLMVELVPTDSAWAIKDIRYPRPGPTGPLLLTMILDSTGTTR